MADSSRNIVLALLVVGVAIAVFYMMDPTFGGLLGRQESFQNSMSNSHMSNSPMLNSPMTNSMNASMNASMNTQATPEPILPKNVPASVGGMKVEQFQDNQQKNVSALLGAQDALVKALKNASANGSTSGFMNKKKSKESFATMKPKKESFKGMYGDKEGFQAADAPSGMDQPMDHSMNSSKDNSMEGYMNHKNHKNHKNSSSGIEGFQNQSSTPFPEATQPANCYPKNQLSPQELLPSDPNSKWASVNPQGSGDIGGKNFLSAGALIGVNTIGQSLRNANQQLRSEPSNPQSQVSIWNQSTIEPDLQRRPLEGF